MKKHAYLIMVHNEFHMLKKLIHELDDERNDIYIHIDKKTKCVDEDLIASWVAKSGVYFVPRMKIFWGTLSMVKCEFSLLEAATRGNYHYYHLISGVDFPLKSQDAIHQYFYKENSEFLSHHLEGDYGDHYLYKIKYYFPLTRFVGKGVFDGPGKRMAFFRWLGRQQMKLLAYQEKLGVDRTKKYKGYTFYKGGNWFSITHDYALYVISQKKNIYRMFWLTNCPDEIFMTTLALNSSFAKRVKNTSLREIDWNRGRPYEYQEEDINLLRASEAFFARKISYDRHPLLINKLICDLHHQKEQNCEPLISIIVPCYNIKDYLQDCIDSLIHQTYTNTEILLINDGSTDGTGNIAKEYADRYDNVFYYCRENGGLSAARNTGIELSGGEYISFVDSDDWVDEHYIEKLYYAMVDNMAEISVCGYIREDSDREAVTFDYNRVISPNEAMRVLGDIYPKENVLLVISPNKLYKRSVIGDIRYPEGKIHEDEYIAHRLIAAADSIAVIQDCLYHYRIRKDSITGTDKSQNRNHLDYLDALRDRAACADTMQFQNVLVYSLYAYFEGMKQLMIRYTDETIEKNRLYGNFRKQASDMYIRYFKSLDSRQKREYLKLIFFTKNYRNKVKMIQEEK